MLLFMLCTCACVINGVCLCHTFVLQSMAQNVAQITSIINITLAILCRIIGVFGISLDGESVFLGGGGGGAGITWG